MSEPLYRRFLQPLFLLSLVLGLVVFFKNAWVSEDAYIIFRSIEQLFAGNGPVWNAHERVQAFTSPLWFVVLLVPRLVSTDVFLNALAVSLLCWVAGLFLLQALFKDGLLSLMAVVLLVLSKGFFDYTSSGLENGLGFLLLAVYLYAYVSAFHLFRPGPSDAAAFPRRFFTLMMAYGLLICVRHDLGLLLFPPTLFVLVYALRSLPFCRVLKTLLWAGVPFVVSTGFSLIYYGFPFPNTAYAKLNTGLSHAESFTQGTHYFFSSLQHDPVTLIIIGLALLLLLFFRPRLPSLALAGGLIINLAYILYVGGDFMQGRFFSYAYFCAVIILSLSWGQVQPMWPKVTVLAALIAYGWFGPVTPLTAPYKYVVSEVVDDYGISDERSCYAQLSLRRYLRAHRQGEAFSTHYWAEDGRAFAAGEETLAVRHNVGLFGYYARLDQIVIDPLALTDPLLARLPAKGSWRIGHFERAIPEGYLESIRTGECRLVDPELNDLYRKIKIVTESERLFTRERLALIVRLNGGSG